MAIRNGQLPAYRIDNAMINFQPLASAVDGYREGIGVAGKSTAQINAANAMQAGDYELAASETARSGDVSGAMAMRKHPGEMRAQEDAARTREVQRFAGRAQELLAITDPAQRRARATEWFGSDARFAPMLREHGYDGQNPDPILQGIVSEARGYRDPDEVAHRRAQTRLTNAQADGANLMPVAPGTTVLDRNTRQPVYRADPTEGFTTVPAGSTVIDRRTGQPILTTERPLTADDRRAIRTSEDVVTNTNSVVGALERALELNGETFTGTLARVRSRIGTSDLPGTNRAVDRTRAENTRELDQLLSLESIKQMSEVLKGATTDREMGEFQRILSNPSTPPDIRERTIKRMLQLAEGHIADNTARRDEIRGGTYYRPGGGQSGRQQAGSRTSPHLVDNEAGAAGLPPGAYFRTPDGVLRRVRAR